MKQILITGGSGLIGTALTKRLALEGFDCAILSTSTKKVPGTSTFFWNPTRFAMDLKALDNIDAIIHLAGANIGDHRWSEKRKKQIVSSRIQSAQFLFETLKRRNQTIDTFISASAVGYYGTKTSETIFAENDFPSNDFLGETCQQWEKAADLFGESGVRTVKIRTGVVLSPKGGVLAKTALPIKLGIGAPLGNGKQYLPWIHTDDLCEIYLKALTDTNMQGAYNAVAPEHDTNDQFTRILASVLNKPLWLPNIPSFFLQALFGERSQLLLEGSRVSADKLLTSGFQFKFPGLENALIDLLNR